MICVFCFFLSQKIVFLKIFSEKKLIEKTAHSYLWSHFFENGFFKYIIFFVIIIVFIDK